MKSMAYGNKFDRNRPPREYTKTTCTACGKECEVPFKPTEGKPVYCKECYAIHAPPREDRRRRF